MIIHREFEQNSLDWGMYRAGKVTASEAGNLLTPHFKRRKGDMVESYLSAKVAERWLGGLLPGFSGLDMDLGKILEQEAIPYLKFEHNMPLERVGFVSDDKERIGCSPDGAVLVNESNFDYGCEIKCPQAKTHCRYLLNNELPEEYRPQVHFSMYVTGADRWYFVSYHRHFPTFVLEVKRDKEAITEIYFALEEFLPRVEAGVKRLEELNGGPREQMKAERNGNTFEHDPDDVMP